jgi:hypothetical protein
LLVEGNDFRLLSDLFDVLHPDDRDGLAVLPHVSIGGWSAFPYAIGSSMFLRNAGGDQISVYCLLDADYHTPVQKAARRDQAKRSDVRLHIWSRKEIENYLLDARVIQRAIQSRTAKRTKAPTVQEVELELQRIALSLHDDVFEGFSNEYLLDDRKSGVGGAMKAARAHLAPLWTTLESMLQVIPGKVTLGRIAKWAQDEFGTSLNASLIARSFRASEVPAEMSAVLNAIATGQQLPASSATAT